jgi:hypothetical protein
VKYRRSLPLIVKKSQRIGNRRRADICLESKVGT